MHPISTALRLFSIAFLATGAATAQLSFGPSQEIGDAFSNSIRFARTADMDGDGDLDVIACEEYGVRVLWWENDGAGHFGNRREWQWGDLEWEVIALEDWNGDGRADVWLRQTDQDSTLEIDRGNYFIAPATSDGTIGPAQSLLSDIDLGLNYGEDLVADLNGDFRPDLITGTGVFYAQPDGSYSTPAVALPVEASGMPSHYDRDDLSILDWDGDGWRDILIVGSSTNWKLLLVRNAAGVAFEAPITLLAPPQEGGMDFIRVFQDVLAIPETDSEPPKVLVIEYPKTGTRTLKIYRRNPDGSLGTDSSIPLVESEYFGKLRLGPDDRIYVFSGIWTHGIIDPVSKTYELSLGSTSPTLIEIATIPGASAGPAPSVVELDGDTLPDLFIPIASHGFTSQSSIDTIVWRKGTAPESYENELRNIVRGEGELTLRHVGDMDGDGDIDILVEDSGLLMDYSIYPGSRRIDLWLNVGTGNSFELVNPDHGSEVVRILDVRDIVDPLSSNPESPPLSTRSWPANRMDILIQASELVTPWDGSSVTTIAWLLQDDDGTFHRCNVSTEHSTERIPIHHLVDWDSDGIKDLLVVVDSVVSEFSTSQASLHWRKGTGTWFVDPQQLFSSGHLYDGRVVDLDWDGDLDFIAPDGLFPEGIFWLENDGDGNIVSTRPYTAGPIPSAADFDGDGHLDGIDSDHIYLARPELIFEERSLPESSYFSLTPSYLDLDQDGDTDFLASVSPQTLYIYSRLEWWENGGDASFGPAGTEGYPVAPARWCDRRGAMMGDMDGDGTPDLVIAASQPRLEWFKITRPSEPTAFTDWMSATGLTGHSAGPNGDWDLDGVLNWNEFAFGSNPTLPDPNHPGRPRLEAGPSGWAYTFQRRTDAASLGLTYDNFHSFDLSTWNPWSPAETSESTEPGYERARFPVTPGQSMEFFKTAVSNPE